MVEDVVELVLVHGRSFHGVFRAPEFRMAEARLEEGLTCEDLQKALLCGHLKAIPKVVTEDPAPVQPVARKQGRRKKGRAT